ncbi:MAG: M20/M25/M40 family metallo-hydrolase, partial [Aestuariibacter sp.]|nr:M20/M25/M40 family metallo-hydrolase [Aestuariibacter sp.]
QLAQDFAPHSVSTVGEMSLKPNSRNTIPGEVFFTVDIRNPDATVLHDICERFLILSQQIAGQYDVEIQVEEIWHNPPVQFNQQCIDAVVSTTAELGYASQSIVSGAGHDACQICRVAPTSMIFVPCRAGLSHNEQEYAEPEDLEAGCNVLLGAILRLAG